MMSGKDIRVAYLLCVLLALLMLFLTGCSGEKKTDSDKEESHSSSVISDTSNTTVADEPDGSSATDHSEEAGSVNANSSVNSTGKISSNTAVNSSHDSTVSNKNTVESLPEAEKNPDNSATDSNHNTVSVSGIDKIELPDDEW